MNIVTLDFETYYSRECGFSSQNTQQYVMDKNFECLMVAVKINTGPTEVIQGTHEEIGQQLRKLVDWTKYAVLAHNTRFDAAIMVWLYNIKPKFFLDSMSMMNARIKPITGSSKLAVGASYYGLEDKGTAVGNAINKHRDNFTNEEWIEYEEYCIHDVDLCYDIFMKLLPDYPRPELVIIDQNIRMFVYPQLELDGRLLRQHQREIKEAKEDILANPVLTNAIGTNEEEIVKALRSDGRFAELLTALGCPVKEKWSDKKQIMVPAFAKTDQFMLRLVRLSEHHPVGILARARIAMKSTIEETRTDRFLNLSELSPMLPVPLRYSAAHTHRFGGDDALNLQNLKRGSTLRYAIKAPAGKKIVVADLAQVEARVNAWLCQEQSMLDVWRKGGDIYCAFASQAFGFEVTKGDKEERFLGKTGILGLGFGMGLPRFTDTLRDAGIENYEVVARSLFDTYRRTYKKIVGGWKHLELRWREALAVGGRITYDAQEISYIEGDQVYMPHGLTLMYPHVHYSSADRSIVFDKVEGIGRSYERKLWGGLLVENHVQAIARAILADQWLRIFKRTGLRPALQVHDELIYVVDEGQAQNTLDIVIEEMRISPSWCADLPLDAEGDIADNYGEAK